MNEDTVREELAELRAGWDRLATAIDSAADEDRARLLSVEDAAAYLGGLPVTTVQTLVKAKQIEHVKIGRSTAFQREHLDAYIDAHTVKPQRNPWGMTDLALRNIP